MNIYAIVDAQSRDVERLLRAAPADAPPDGYVAVELAAAVKGWPDGKGVLRCSPVGALYFEDMRPLADIKADRRAEINVAAMAAMLGVFAHGGKQLECDAISRHTIEAVSGFVALTGALPPGLGGVWRAADNTTVSIANVAAWALLHGAMVAHTLATHAKARTLKAQVDAATTAEAVEAVQW